MADATHHEDSTVEDGEVQETEKATTSKQQPTEPSNQPPLPDEPEPEDDGWEPVWDPTSQRCYFYNRYSGVTQWENPRVPDATAKPPGDQHKTPDPSTYAGAAGSYNPAIHGDYDPNADYAVAARQAQEEAEAAPPGGEISGTTAEEKQDYLQAAHFNRFTGRFQNSNVHPSRSTTAHTDEAKSHRQMNAFFDVNATSEAHDGRSLKAERAGQKLTKKQLKEYREKRRSKKEEKRRAWLLD